MQYNLTYRQFQSTLPMRGATRTAPGWPRRTTDFNPRSPCGERHLVWENVGRKLDFNPRSPCGERRSGSGFVFYAQIISIHAPHAGSDP